MKPPEIYVYEDVRGEPQIARIMQNGTEKYIPASSLAKPSREALGKMIEAAREIKRLRDAQAEYTKKIQLLAREAKKTGKSLTHLIPAPVVTDYGTAVDRLLAALKAVEG